MLNLFRKDLRIFYGETSMTKKRIVKYGLKLLFYLFVIGVLFFVFYNILKKTSVYPNASLPLLSLFLFGVSFIQTFSFIGKEKKLIFEEKDYHLMSILPVLPVKVILSKLILILISYLLTTIILSFPLLLAYGLCHNLTIGFYFASLLYPVIIFPLDIGLSLILVCPYKYLKDRLASSYVIKGILYVIIFFLAAYIYSLILNVFVTLVAGGDLLTIFTQKRINAFADVCRCMPSYYIASLITESKWIYLLFIPAEIVFFAFSVMVISYFYFHQMKRTDREYIKRKKLLYKKTPLFITLVIKEIRILLRNESYLLSFVVLLILQPFLGYLIVYSLNTIFRNGTFSYYLMVVPDFVTFMDLFLLILLGLIINQGASSYIQDEKRTLLLMKSIPVSYKKQLLIKVMIPYILSSLSFIITDVILLISHVISFSTFTVGLILVLMILFIYDCICLFEELRMNIEKGRSYAFSSVFTYVIPLVFFGVSVILSCLGVNVIISYLCGILVFAGFGIYFIIYIFKNMEEAFSNVELGDDASGWRK